MNRYKIQKRDLANTPRLPSPSGAPPRTNHKEVETPALAIPSRRFPAVQIQNPRVGPNLGRPTLAT